jgi:hypothetical protein
VPLSCCVGRCLRAQFPYPAVRLWRRSSLQAFHKAYYAIMKHMKKGPWFVDVHMSSGEVVNPVYRCTPSTHPIFAAALLPSTLDYP